MFEHKHYVPILKAKDGEFKGLRDTREATKDSMTPMFEIPKIAWDYKNNRDSKTLDGHLAKLPDNIAKCWKKRRIFIDSPFLDGNAVMSNGVHHMTDLFHEFRALDVNAVPVTGLSRHGNYKAAVRDISISDKKGICLRLSNADFINPDLKAIVDADLAFYGLSPAAVDLVMDMGSIANASDLLPLSIQLVINSKIPYVNKWRTFTLAATAFPDNMAGIAGDSISTIERSEWLIWEALLGSGLKRLPTFGDYSISSPEIFDMNPLTMSMSASIRYTSDNDWVIFKGRSVKTQGYAQFHNLSQQLVRHAAYCGPAYSWGDSYVNNCAARTATSGNATTWRQVGNNHHFEKVIQQIATIP